MQMIGHEAIRKNLKRVPASAFAENAIGFGNDSWIGESRTPRKCAQRKEIGEPSLVLEAG
jgi:hypothetical protein